MTSIQCPHCFETINLEAAAVRRAYSLSIVCITQGKEWSRPFIERLRAQATDLGAEFVIGFDLSGGETNGWLQPMADLLVPVTSAGYIESVLNTVIRHANGSWVLRVDDDESLPPAMIEWLRRRSYFGSKLWRMPTAALWGDERHFITTPPFWQDTHVRLASWYDAAGWPDKPHGKLRLEHTAKLCPAAIFHHKYLIKSYEERRQLAADYEQKEAGAGEGRRLVFNVPEDVLSSMTLHEVGDGLLTKVRANEGERVETLSL